MSLKNKVLVVSIVVAVFSTTYLIKSWKHKKQDDPAAPAVAVTPITDQKLLDELPPLPNNEKPVLAIPVDVPEPKPGHVIKPAVVVSSAGNTFVVFTDKVDCGFRFEPKVSIAGSTDFLIGVDVTFFTWWRINADALAYIPVRQDMDFTRSRGGVGASFQITQNTSAGAACLWDLGERRTLAAFVSLKF